MNDNQDYRTKIYEKYISIGKKSHRPVSNDLSRPRFPLHDFLLKKIDSKNLKNIIIDLGAGDGEFIQFLGSRGFSNVKGYDISPEQVQKSKARSQNAVEQKTIWDALNEYDDGSVDIVFCIDLIEHLTKLELLDLSKKILNVLKTDGLWVVHAPK